MGAREIKLLGILSRKKTAGAATALLGTCRGASGADKIGAGAASKLPGAEVRSTTRAMAKLPRRFSNAGDDEAGACLAKDDTCVSAGTDTTPPEVDEELSIPCVSRMSTGEGFISPLGNTRRLQCCGSGGSVPCGDGIAQDITPPDTLQKLEASAAHTNAKPRSTPPPFELIAAAAAAVHGTKADCKSECYDTDGDCDDYGNGDGRRGESPRFGAGEREAQTESKAEAKEENSRRSQSQKLGTSGKK